MLWISMLLMAAMLCGSAMLTVRATVDYRTWKVAILAGEFGHWLGWVALVLAGIAAGLSLETAGWKSGVAGATAGLALLAAGLFARPALAARKLARTLPGRLEQAFGSAPVMGSPWSWRRLYRCSRVTPVKPETRVFAHLGEKDTLAMDFYRAEGAVEVPAGKAPCVIVIHGGGWDGGDRGMLPALNHRLARRGVAVAAITYRLAPKHPWPAQREDVLAAIAYLKSHATELGIDATRLVLLGRSAGGQLATAVAYGINDPAIRAVVALYAPHDLHFVWSIASEDGALNSVKLMRQYLGGPPDGERAALYDQGSGQHLAAPGAPPTLLMHGTLDELVWVRHSRRLAARLQALAVPHVLVELPWATHAYDFNLDGPGGQLTEFAIGWVIAATTRAPSR
jgi:acetyl esterase/lipase